MADRPDARRRARRLEAAGAVVAVVAVVGGADWATPPAAADMGPCPRTGVALLRAGPFSRLEFRPGGIPPAHALAEPATISPPWPDHPPGAIPAGTGEATVDVTYEGFPPEAVAAFEAAVRIWERSLASSVPIRVEARFESLKEDVLGGAAPAMFVRDPDRATPWYPLALADAVTGVDLLPRTPDIVARFNDDPSLWYFGTDGRAPDDRFDFTTVVLHELSHGLGLIGGFSIDDAGIASWGASAQDRYPTIFDTFVSDPAGRHLVGGLTNNSADLAAALTSGDLVFDGPEARRAGRGGAPRLYAPTPWEAGTSAYHLDREELEDSDPDRLIGPDLPPGLAIHRPGPILRGIFLDLGWPARRDVESGADTSGSTAVATSSESQDGPLGGAEPSAEDSAEVDPEAAAPLAAPAQPAPHQPAPAQPAPAGARRAATTRQAPLTPPAQPAEPAEPAHRPDKADQGESVELDELAEPVRLAGSEKSEERTDCETVTLAAGAPNGPSSPEAASAAPGERRAIPRVAVPSNALALTGDPSRLPLLAGGALLLALGELVRRQAIQRWSR